MKFIYYPLVLLWLSIFGQVVLWFGQAKYTLYLSQGTSELKRKFLALVCIFKTAIMQFEGVPKRWINVSVTEGQSIQFCKYISLSRYCLWSNAFVAPLKDCLRKSIYEIDTYMHNTIHTTTLYSLNKRPSYLHDSLPFLPIIKLTFAPRLTSSMVWHIKFIRVIFSMIPTSASDCTKSRTLELVFIE